MAKPTRQPGAGVAQVQTRMTAAELKGQLRQWREDFIERTKIHDLSHTDFSGEDLHGLELSGTIFVSCNFNGANLTRATLLGAVLTRSSMRGANLREVDLHYAKCDYVDFSGANLRDADLGEIEGAWAQFEGADCYGINLSNARLYKANLRVKDGSCATIHGASLTYVHAESACFDSADFSGSNFQGANFANCSLNGDTRMLKVTLDRGARLTTFAGVCFDTVQYTPADWKE